MKATTKVAMALGAAIGLTAVFGGVSTVQAQEQNQQCAPAEQVEEYLSQRASEQMTGSGRLSAAVDLELFSSEEGGYTLVTHGSDGQRCLQSAGDHLVIIDESQIEFTIPAEDLTPEQQKAVRQMVAGSRGTCNTPAELFNALSARYQEEPVFAGIASDGSIVVLLDTPDGALKADGTPSEDSWTLLTIQKDHPMLSLDGAYSACIGPSGESWTDIEPDSDAIVGPNIQVSAPAELAPR